MGRPPLPIKRDKQLNLKLTKPELELVKSRADAFGLRAVDYGRAIVLNDRRALEPRQRVLSTIERAWLVQIRRLGNNLNQIARRLHAFKEPPPPSLEPLLRDVRQLLDRVQVDDN